MLAIAEDNILKASGPVRAKLPLREKQIEPQQEFLRRITLECRRAERSKQRFIVALLQGVEKQPANISSIAAMVATATRQTDSCGWYEEFSTLGIVFPELGAASAESARDTISGKIKAAMQQSGVSGDVTLSVHILPLDLNHPAETEETSGNIYGHVDLSSSSKKRTQLGIKRVIDLTGSILLLVLLSPLMAVIAIAVKCGSRGPILFRQTRVGQRGKQFTFLKFRSMKIANDPSLHENYVKEFIRGTAVKNTNAKGEGVFKLTHDPRVTPLGSLLRKSSLDELPQLWNVLRGDMSLVGPRPPIPYEVECYDLWHQRRVLELRPGITGLWQVSGRSRIGFNDMVRLDLEYARTWSPWLDCKILLRTPLAVLGGSGAH